MEGEKRLSKHSKDVVELAIEKMIGGEDKLSPMHAAWKHVLLPFCLEIEDKAASYRNSERSSSLSSSVISSRSCLFLTIVCTISRRIRNRIVKSTYQHILKRMQYLLYHVIQSSLYNSSKASTRCRHKCSTARTAS